MFLSEKYTHTYPFCWRCGTPLLYYARDSWYIRTSQYKDRLVELNNKINWVPEHIREGRFGNWLSNNIDWSLSRERYWVHPCRSGNARTAKAGNASVRSRNSPKKPGATCLTWTCTVRTWMPSPGPAPSAAAK